MNPRPEQYDFLWLVNNQSFLASSIWASIEYPQYHFLVTCRHGEHRLYVAKKDRNRLAAIGYRHYTTEFPKFRKRMSAALGESKKLVNNARRSDPRHLSHKELADIAEKLIASFLALWSVYFFTETFCLDTVERAIKKRGPLHRQLKRRVKEVQKARLHVRWMLNASWFEDDHNVLRPIYNNIARRLGRQDLSSYHYQELLAALCGKKLPNVDRRVHVWGKFNGWRPITGRRAETIIRLFDRHFFSSKELKGQIARPGYYRGRVKIVPFDLKINISQKIAEMKRGDVLVTGSTGPEMILACKKAGAIVTEERGITSHAAIISRELGIPCIIGTKVATQVLKDGDWVEVDAHKGIIRKI